MENKNNARYQATHHRLKETYKTLLIASRDGRVSVAQIVKAAKVNRKTFYLHFEAIDDLIAEVAADMGTNLALATKAIDFKRDKDYMRQIFFLIHEDPSDFHRYVVTSKSTFFFYQEMMASYVDQVSVIFANRLELPLEETKLLISYISSGIMMLYRKWLFSGKSTSEDVVIELANQLVSGGLSNFL